MEPTTPRRPLSGFYFAAMVVVIISVLVLGGFAAWRLLYPLAPSVSNKPTNQAVAAKVARFGSDQEFRKYFVDGQALGNSYSLGGFAGSTAKVTTGLAPAPTAGPAAEPGSQAGLGAADNSQATIPTADRYSTTNVQVTGIDEPDIVKTDGSRLYISSDQPDGYAIPEPLSIVKGVPAPIINNTTSIVSALPVATMAKLGSLASSGNMLLAGHHLIIFSHNGLYGYDLTDPKNPNQVWKNTYEANNYLQSARLMNGKIYLVMSSYVSSDTVCPLPAMSIGSRTLSIPCTDIYRPATIMPIDTTYTAMIISPDTGAVEKILSFVGGSGSTVVSMFPDNLYVAYTISPDPVAIYYDFYRTAASDLIGAAYFNRLQRLSGYDLSLAAKMTEMEVIFQEYSASLDQAARTKWQTDLNQRMKTYVASRTRDFTRTGIVRIDLPNLTVADTGQVPGQLLNQFALDEYQNHLRVATTSSGGWFFGGSDTSVNDVYVLDQHLTTTGSVLDLGKGEQIYSVRFIGHRGYVVTFKQVDPFYVLDLSSPTKPVKAGELTIPGYSSYLHALSDTLILGVGQDNRQVKMTLFDVSDPANPKAQATQELAAGWTDIQSNHHAFLLDQPHSAVFLPAGGQGFVVTYTPTTLHLAATVSSLTASRAVYINDNLYVIGQHNIAVLDETDWTQVKTATF